MSKQKEENSMELGLMALAITTMCLIAEYLFIARPSDSELSEVFQAAGGFIFEYGTKIRIFFVFFALMVFVLMDKGNFLPDWSKTWTARILGFVVMLIMMNLIVNIRSLTLEQFKIMYPVAIIAYTLAAILLTSQIGGNGKLLKDKFGFVRTFYLEKGIGVFRWVSIKEGAINIKNGFRGLVGIGNPGSGKSYTLVEPLIEAIVKQGITGVIYCFKTLELAKYVHDCYHNFLTTGRTENKEVTDKIKLWNICFSDLSRSHRINPIHPRYLESPADANEMAMTVMFNLKKEWIKSRDFWADSGIIYFKAIIWFLREKYPQQCTLPHAIAIALMPYEKVLAALKTVSDCEQMIEPLTVAERKKAEGQISGQITSLQIPIDKLNSPEISWVLSESDFNLQLNDPKEPGLLCINNDPKRSESYSPPISLIIYCLMKILNKPKMLPSTIQTDEGPTLFIPNYEQIGPAISRSNKVSYQYFMQSYSQLIDMYGEPGAKKIVGTLGNILVMQLSDIDEAEKVSRLLGEDKNEQTSISLDKSGKKTSSSVSVQKEKLIKPEEIVVLEVGRVVGKLADTGGKYSPIFNVKPDIEKLESGHQFNSFVKWERKDKEGNVETYLPTHEEIYELAKKKHKFIKDEALFIIEESAIEAIVMAKVQEKMVFPEHFNEEGHRIKTRYGDPIDKDNYIHHRYTGKIIGHKEQGYYNLTPQKATA